ncbi:PepSY domain-containing protein [Corynebacterium sp. H127]|uniref:PepSY-associated TM helix domain-containing protein n=1 Tax=Corynebacterium sp. H127 TaxID=3133418 RepID=UPI0030A01EFC
MITQANSYLRASVRRLHLIAGLLVGPFILVAALTGFFYAFAPTAEQVVYHDAYVAQTPGTSRPLSEQTAVAQREHPDLKVSAVQVKDGANTRVLFKDESLPSKSYRQAVFVDPVSLEVKDQFIQYGSSNASPLRTWLSRGHKDLWLGEPGRIYSELAASWLGALAIAGLYLMLTQRVKQKRMSVRRHSQLGAWLFPGLLFLTVTGLTWSLVAGENIGKVRKMLNWMSPTPPSQSEMVPFDQTLAVAREQGLTGMLELSSTGVARESRGPFRFAIDQVIVGPDGQLVGRIDFEQWPLAAKLTNWLIELHMGILFGIWSEIALGLLAAGIIVITVLGYVAWFRSARKGLPKPVRFQPVLAVLLVIYAVFAPLFGISLLAFVLIDVLLQLSRRRAKTKEAVNA